MKTTLKKLIAEVDFNNPRLQSAPAWETLSELFDIYGLHWSNDKRLKSVFIQVWYCTDTYVGLRAYFLDDVFIATSWQPNRKSDEEFTFTSIEAARMLKDYLFSLLEETSEIDINVFKEDDLDEEFEDTFTVEYNSQILHNKVYYEGEEAEVLQCQYPWSDKEKYFHTVKIKTADNKTKEVNCKSLKLKYNAI